MNTARQPFGVFYLISATKGGRYIYQIARSVVDAFMFARSYRKRGWIVEVSKA